MKHREALLGLLSFLPLFASATDCTAIQVQSGDSCASLATRCGISGSDFTKYNPSPDLCSTLSVGEHVCCSSGTLPNYSPKPNPDGSCATHYVGNGEYCQLIASNYSLTTTQLENFNNDTWGWMGCDDLAADFVMCVSTGTPPMPAAVPGAVCGPQVPGTKPPSDMSQLWSLNQCPLNACCDIWGQCGTTSEFCTMTKSPTGAPGTAANGTNGCISNCGTSIINNAVPPSQFKAVGYFEAWNSERPCLTMAPVNIDVTKYTHVHFSFGAITSGSWEVDMSQFQDFFEEFKSLPTVKKVVSFGGWAFSTDASTYAIFREAVSDANYETFAQNVVNFAVANKLDGVDFDWEYPGELDIPGIPPSSKVDAEGYLKFLQAIRSKMPSDITISIAAPASYWYLKAFPIQDIANVVDYIVFMTYDLHGQWDYDNKFADPGCPEGSCLRSHVNLTETMNALSMITKAGVGAYQIVVGVASYGRSFQMTQAGCAGPMCTFTGPQSGAQPGRCTQTAGYLANAEIYQIAANDSSAKSWYDAVSDSTIMTWDSTQWVAYMNNATKSSRISKYQGLNFGGWVEWAIDLESFDEGNANDTVPPIPDCNGCPPDTFPPCLGNYPTMDDINANLGSIPDYCVDVYQMAVLNALLETAFTNYTNLLNDGYDGKFSTYQSAVQKQVPGEIIDFINQNQGKYFTCGSRACPQLPDEQNNYISTANQGSFTFSNETGFYDDLAAAYGIDQSWLTIGTYHSQICSGRCIRATYTGIPVPLSNYQIPNPKDIIAAALGNLTTLNGMLSDATVNSGDVFYSSDTDGGASTMGDTVTGSMLPVYLAQSAILQMDQVVTVADQIDAEKAKEIILAFIGAVLFIIPGIGEELEAADVALIASMGRLLSLAGDAGNAALDVYNTIQNPDNAIFAIFDGLSVAKSFSKAADAFKGLKAGDLANMGDTIKDGTASVQKGCVSCI